MHTLQHMGGFLYLKFTHRQGACFAGSDSHGLEEARNRKHVEVDSVEKGYNESFSVGPEFNRAAEFARKAAEESASASAFSKDAYKR